MSASSSFSSDSKVDAAIGEACASFVEVASFASAFRAEALSSATIEEVALSGSDRGVTKG